MQCLPYSLFVHSLYTLLHWGDRERAHLVVMLQRISMYFFPTIPRAPRFAQTYNLLLGKELSELGYSCYKPWLVYCAGLTIGTTVYPCPFLVSAQSTSIVRCVLTKCGKGYLAQSREYM